MHTGSRPYDSGDESLFGACGRHKVFVAQKLQGQQHQMSSHLPQQLPRLLGRCVTQRFRLHQSAKILQRSDVIGRDALEDVPVNGGVERCSAHPHALVERLSHRVSHLHSGSQVLPHERLAQAGGEGAHLEGLSVHHARHQVRVMHYHGQLAVPGTEEAAVVDVGGADDNAAVVDDHELGVHVDQLGGELAQQVVMATQAVEGDVLERVRQHLKQPLKQRVAIATADGGVVPVGDGLDGSS